MKKFIIILSVLCCYNATTAQRTIKGQILDHRQAPLVNVKVALKGATDATLTDDVGKFVLKTNRDRAVLVLSRLGFTTQEVPVSFQEREVISIKISLDEKNYQLEEVLVNADKSLVSSLSGARKRQQRIAGATSVVSTKPLLTQRSLTLKDALQLEPGVIIQDFFGANDQPRLNIRGSGIQSNPQQRGVMLLQDGMPINAADGSYIIGVLSPRSADYIEVFKGANALKYGAATLGGAINMVSKNGHNSSPLSVKLEGGSFDYIGANVSTGLVFGKNDLYLSTSYNKASGFRKWNKSRQWNTALNFGRKFSERFESRFYLSYADLSFDIPGPLTQKQMDDDPKQINEGIKPPNSIGPNVLRDKPGRETRLLRVANKSVYQMNDHAKMTFSVYYQYGDDTFTYPAVVGVKHSLNNDFGSSLAFHHQKGKNTFNAGLTASTGRSIRDYFVNIRKERGRKYASNNLWSTNLVLYLEDVYDISTKLSATASVQLSYNTRNNKDLFDNVSKRPFYAFATSTYGTFDSQDSSLDQNYFGFNPKVGLIYNLNKEQQLFFNVSRSYEPPTFDELINVSQGNPNRSPGRFESVKLEAQTATTLELGSRGAYKAISWDLSLYRSWVKNEILTTTDLFGISGTTRNAPDQTIHQGVELGLGATIFSNIFSNKNDAVSFKGVYNYSNFFFSEGIYKDKNIAGIPEHYINASLSYKYPQGIFVALNTEWMPNDTPTDHQNTIFQKAYQLLGFRVGYQRKNWTVFVQGNNITNQKYASSYLIRDVVIDPPPPVLTPTEVTTFIPGSGANYVFGVNYNF